MQEKYFRITEFARLAKTSRKTLQYYDELGLFRPAYVAENGYRCYSLHQLDRLALIAALRDMGLSLREIKSYLQQEDGENLNALLEAQLDRAEEMMERLRCRKALLTEMFSDMPRYFNTPQQAPGGKDIPQPVHQDRPVRYGQGLPADV